LFRCDSSRRKKSREKLTGGVCFYVREDIGASCEVIYSHLSPSVQLFCLYSNVENLAILVVYIQTTRWQTKWKPFDCKRFHCPTQWSKNSSFSARSCSKHL